LTFQSAVPHPLASKAASAGSPLAPGPFSSSVRGEVRGREGRRMIGWQSGGIFCEKPALPAENEDCLLSL